MVEIWDDKFEYLLNSRFLYHNDDYFEFLVKKVWNLTDEPRRIIDFGCGYGFMGLKLLPLLPEGSTYTGIDQSPDLLIKGREVFAESPYPVEFVESQVYDIPFKDNQFDLAISHALLMHIPDAEKALHEMIRVIRNGGLVITCEANRNAHTALWHIDETSEQEDTPLWFFQRMNKVYREQYGIDYNIGIKLPVLMHKAGLKHVQARMDDSVRCLFPPIDTKYKQKLFEGLCNEGYGVNPPDDERLKQWTDNLVKLGFTKKEAETEITRELTRNFRETGKHYHTVFAGLLSYSFGTVDK